ncbi:CrcB family protein [Agromyces sp. CFH 90414]|uniref:Fluoride-specific ion channel FluC n=1 Tax=Agromyces agglutinans TaxID=2662258 RepID=A0A6I2FAA8_9MICO|nr:CrcB family protein [Agromyces agglutinans]MRG59336.1 CrcB family protein [Agromyces agglutinans]
MGAYLAVFAGGLLGTGLRLGADLLLPHDDTGFPFSTLLVNLVGAFVLGILAGGLWTRPTTPSWLKAGIGAGVLGSFTTLSAVMASLVLIGTDRQWWLAAGYTAASVIGGLVLAAAGLRLGIGRERRRRAAAAAPRTTRSDAAP